MNERLEINPNEIYPVKGIKSVTYVKPTIKNPNIIVGEFTYFSDEDFENHVTFWPIHTSFPITVSPFSDISDKDGIS